MSTPMKYFRSTGVYSGHKIHRYNAITQRSVCGRARSGDLTDTIKPMDVLCWNCFRENSDERRKELNDDANRFAIVAATP